ncbi:sodium-dependent transporter [Salinicoccus sp. RF5]|uniref:sodium-dependent transporter n=1 Tax=Salinicoccus sp. RF5 TaxID=2748874 RepID=UPI001E53A4BA|nr:sodium-dependent transporter [Salinicoccus sp. RF5]MCC4723685.1 sodium-dependent transporter [Salinicoccus sp. RF5]
MNSVRWGSKIGFVLAAAGSAIGLGALWRFPYMTAEHGGGAFLLVFLVMTLFVGMPLLLSEFVIGRSSQRNPIEGFEYLGGKKFYRVFGWLGNIAVFLLLSFYSVIGGWILIYLIVALGDAVNLIQIDNYGAAFEGIIANPLYVVVAQGLFILLTAFIVAKGVQQGLERASKVMMPLLFVLFLIVIIRSVTLPGAMEGIAFFLTPNISEIDSTALLYALGQSFFALSIGATTMITYSSYLGEEHNLTQSALSIVIMNVVISIMAGFAIFPAIASLGMEAAEGPGLVFIVLPQVFGEIPLGMLFYILFLGAFLFATLTSSISMIEINVANAIKGNESKRRSRAYIFGFFVFLAGIPSALSYGVLSDVIIFGRSIFDNVDFLVSNIMLPIGALVSTLFVGFIIDRRVTMNQLNVDEGSKMYGLYKFWILMLRFVLPVVILIVFAVSIIG